MQFNAEAQKKIKRNEYSINAFVTASIARTPVARLVSRSLSTSLTMEIQLSVRRPVAIAAGNVADCVLKYTPYAQPGQHASCDDHVPRFRLDGCACTYDATRTAVAWTQAAPSAPTRRAPTMLHGSAGRGIGIGIACVRVVRAAARLACRGAPGAAAHTHRYALPIACCVTRLSLPVPASCCWRRLLVPPPA